MPLDALAFGRHPRLGVHLDGFRVGVVVFGLVGPLVHHDQIELRRVEHHAAFFQRFPDRTLLCRLTVVHDTTEGVVEVGIRDVRLVVSAEEEHLSRLVPDDYVRCVASAFFGHGFPPFCSSRQALC